MNGSIARSLRWVALPAILLGLGILFAVRPLHAGAVDTLIEFYNTTLNHYFLTIDPAEAAAIDSGAAGPGWQRTGKTIGGWQSASAAPAGAVAVCRFYGNQARGGPNGHFYTADAPECASVKLDPGWTFERNEFYVQVPANGNNCPAGTTPVYRVYNGRYAQHDSNHRYVTDIATYNQMVSAGWGAEGVVFCGGAATTGSTAGVACPLSYSAFNGSPKIMASSIYNWVCGNTLRTLTGTGIPDHAVTGGNFATPASTQNINVSMPVVPVNTGGVTAGALNVGYALNSVKFDPGTAGTCTSSAVSTAPGGGCVAANGHDPWHIEALGGAFTFGTDESNAHVQPNGQYHYHGMPEGLIARASKGTAMTLVGFAVDGFPIYGRYGYVSAGNPASGTRIMQGSYRKKAVPDAGRPSVAIFPMGTFTQDYEYAAGSGDLDDCNGRTGATPEFPNGIYHYYITNTFPYIQRCVKGKLN